MNEKEIKLVLDLIEKNKDVLEGRVYVMDLDENFVVLGIPQPTKCNFEIMQANQIAIYATRPRLREIYEALRRYYGDENKAQSV
jgi:DNA-binding beta-propeller fold protein YncE